MTGSAAKQYGGGFVRIGHRSSELFGRFHLLGLPALARKLPDLRNREGLSRSVFTFAGAFGAAYGQMRRLDQSGAKGMIAGQVLTYLTVLRLGRSLFRSGRRFRGRYGDEAYQEAFYQYLLPIGGAAAASFVHVLTVPGRRRFTWFIGVPAGLYLTATGALVWRRAINALGIDTAALVHVYFPEASREVQSGLYGVLRHPMFAGLSRILIGLALLRGKITGLGLAGITVAWLHLWISMEEEELVERFGRSYEEYREGVPAMLPDSWETERRLLSELFARE